MLHSFKSFEIPVDPHAETRRWAGDFRHHFANTHSECLPFVGLESHFSVLEIGCGIGRDAIPLTEILTAGRYLGIDIIRESIDWCSANISRNFRFWHFDARDDLHNPGGRLEGSAIRISVARGTMDRVIRQSVFTHLVPELVEHYLCEFRRVLKNDGLVYATCFLVDDAILESARRTDLTQWHLRFDHAWAPGSFVQDPHLPASAVAYTIPRMTELIQGTGLELERPPLPGPGPDVTRSAWTVKTC